MSSLLRHLVAYVVIVTVLFFCAWSFLTGGNVIDLIRFYRFDPVVWKNAAPEQRYYMAKFMVEQDILHNKTRNQVRQMLGEGGTSSTASYYLGPEHGSMFRIDSDWLSIDFSNATEDGLVARATIRSD